MKEDPPPDKIDGHVTKELTEALTKDLTTTLSVGCTESLTEGKSLNVSHCALFVLNAACF